jgi:ribosomal protein L40E
MKCPRCQHENPPQAKFCLECAAPRALRYANCGTQLPPGAKFCFECATPVSASGSQPRFASPEAYTPKLQPAGKESRIWFFWDTPSRLWENISLRLRELSAENASSSASGRRDRELS